jgi:multidrug efflux pump subunit AcrB
VIPGVGAGGTARASHVPRYFTENPQVGWTLVVATVLLGIVAYARMPKRKDPFIKVRAAVAVCAWPGASAERIEALVTRPIEEAIAQNPDVEKIESTSRTGMSIVGVTVRESLAVTDIAKTLDDIDFRLRAITVLPRTATPIQFQKDFGDTAALILTVGSPAAGGVEIALRARAIADALAAERRGLAPGRKALVFNLPIAIDPEPSRRLLRRLAVEARASRLVRDVREVEGRGFIALDTAAPERATLLALAAHLQGSEVATELHPDMWAPAIVDDLETVAAALAAEPGDAYSYRQLDDFTAQIARRLRGLSAVAKVTRAGVLDEQVSLDYSQQRLAALGMSPSLLLEAIGARNAQAPAGTLDAQGRTVAIDTTGEYRSEGDIADTVLGTTSAGTPLYVRDVAGVSRDYRSPALYLNYLTVRDGSGPFRRARAITLSLQMRAGEQIDHFSKQVDGALADLRVLLPKDLLLRRTSDQAQQVDEKIDLFMTSLLEALAIIIVIGFAGFRDWRSGLALALSVPLTMALTFVFMVMLGIDIQQISLGGLILSLGLLVDDPVVAGDAIQHELDAGRPARIAAWLGPTRLARAILFATVTNIVAYLPFLLYSGDVGHFIYSLPVVLTCSLVASRIVSMTFIPLLGRLILRPRAARPKGPSQRLMGWYCGLVTWAIARRYRVLGGSLLFMILGLIGATQLRVSLFPKDNSRLFYIDVFLPEDASLRSTNDAARQAERIVRRVASDFGQAHAGGAGPRQVLHSVTTFIGGPAPRFWYSVSPEQRQLNYAQLLVRVEDQRDTRSIVPLLQDALTSGVPGARIDVRELEDGRPTPRPVEIRFSGEELGTLRVLAAKAKQVFRDIPIADRIRDDWGENGFRLAIGLDQTKAGLGGVSTADVAKSSAEGFSGLPLNVLRDGDKLIPIVGRLHQDERALASDVDSLYVFSASGARMPIGDIARTSYHYQIQKVQHRDHRRTISVSCFPVAGSLPADVMREARGRLAAIAEILPPGYEMAIGGAEEDVGRVTHESIAVGLVSILAIFLALVIQLRSALKPLIVFAAVPFGICGAIVSLEVMGAVFSFMAILGAISLLGIIVSHVIVLFDAIEELRESGTPLPVALLEAGRQRVRPVIITTAATALGLVPLAVHGGPLWEPLCYAQIGGLTLATAITLILVPTLYAICVLDLKWIRWDLPAPGHGHVLGLPTTAIADQRRRQT